MSGLPIHCHKLSVNKNPLAGDNRLNKLPLFTIILRCPCIRIDDKTKKGEKQRYQQYTNNAENTQDVIQSLYDCLRESRDISVTVKLH